MAVGKDDVRRIAELARLRLADADVERFTVQLNSILVHMDRLAELDAKAAQAEAQGRPEAGAPLRDEQTAPDELHRSPAAIATDWREGFFVVPRLAAQERLAEGGDALEAEAGDGG